jgi:hypothetical protein
VAQKLGIEPTAMIRVRAGISFALAEATGEAQCGLPGEELGTLASTLLAVEPALVRNVLDLELEAGEVVADTLGGEPCVFLAGLYRAEQIIPERLQALARGRPGSALDARAQRASYDGARQHMGSRSKHDRSVVNAPRLPQRMTRLPAADLPNHRTPDPKTSAEGIGPAGRLLPSALPSPCGLRQP